MATSVMRVVSGRLALITQLPDAELTEAERTVAQDVRDAAELSIYADELMGNIVYQRRERLLNDAKFYLKEPESIPGVRIDEVDEMELTERLSAFHTEHERIPAVITVGRRAGKSMMMTAVAREVLRNAMVFGTPYVKGTPPWVPTPPAVLKTDPKVPQGTISMGSKVELGHPLQNTFSNREVFKRWNDFLHEIGFHAPNGNDLTLFEPELIGPDGLPARTGMLSFAARELLNYDLPINKIIESNSVKEIEGLENAEFEFHVERAALQSFPEKPQQITNMEEFKNTFGPIKGFPGTAVRDHFYNECLGAPYTVQGMDPGVEDVQTDIDRQIIADMEAATHIPKKYLGTPSSAATAVVTQEIRGTSRKLNTRFKAGEGKWIGSTQATAEGRGPGRRGSPGSPGESHREDERGR